jgi:hypothetical protein
MRLSGSLVEETGGGTAGLGSAMRSALMEAVRAEATDGQA